MIEVVEYVLSLIVTLGILVTIHEYGHFWVARKCGVKVLRFSVGFGKPLWSWTDRHGTEFAVAAIPLGGYVKMLDAREGPVPEEEKDFAFTSKTAGQRIAIASAGPIANFLFAIVAYWMMFLSGFNVLIPTIGSVDEGSVAQHAGLEAGVEIVAVDQRATQGWRDVNLALINRLGESGTIEITTQYSRDSMSETSRLEIEEWLVGQTQTDLVRDLGIHPVQPVIKPVVGRVLDASPASKAGLKEGDLVLSVDREPIDDWFEFVDLVQKSQGAELALAVMRSEQELSLSVRPDKHVAENGDSTWRIGIGVAPFSYPDEMIRTVSYGPIEAIPAALRSTWADTEMTLTAIKKMIAGLVSLDNLSGPITIAQVASRSISGGFEDFLRFLALLSVSLGVLNLLPIPVLDGGHILYYSIEALVGKPIPEKWQELGLRIGLSLILMLMCLAFYNDIMRLQ